MYYNLSLLFTYFFLYAIIGWSCEVIYCSIPAKKFINRGFLNGPYCPIYGVGAILIVSVLAKYINDPVSVFFVSMVSTSALEYFTSWAMEVLFHAKWWDYSKHKYNINGRVCLLNSVLFGFMGLALMYLVHPFVERFIGDFSPFALEVFATVCAVIFIADIVTSTLETVNLKNKVSRISELATFIDEDTKEKRDELHKKITDLKAYRRYSHNRIINAFPNMVSKDDHASLELYRKALEKAKKMKKIRKANKAS